MPETTRPYLIETTRSWHEYELLDSGEGKTLERFGKMVLAFPYPQAFWPKSKPELWTKADARYQLDPNHFGGEWRTEEGTQKSWPLRWETLRFQVQLHASVHIGVSPTEINHWNWLHETLPKAGSPIKLLNLWAGTGLLNLVAAQQDASITHVDSSKHAIAWAMANQKLSNLKDAPIRYIQEDPIKFIKREARRGQRYNALMMHFPQSDGGQPQPVLDFLKRLPELIDATAEILDSELCFLLITAPEYIHPCTTEAVATALMPKPGMMTSGEIHTQEKSTGRSLPRAAFTRWMKN